MGIWVSCSWKRTNHKSLISITKSGSLKAPRDLASKFLAETSGYWKIFETEISTKAKHGNIPQTSKLSRFVLFWERFDFGLIRYRKNRHRHKKSSWKRACTQLSCHFKIFSFILMSPMRTLNWGLRELPVIVWPTPCVAPKWVENLNFASLQMLFSIFFLSKFNSENREDFKLNLHLDLRYHGPVHVSQWNDNNLIVRVICLLIVFNKMEFRRRDKFWCPNNLYQHQTHHLR